MLRHLLGILPICFAATEAFKDSSPFFFFSTAISRVPTNNPRQLTTSGQLLPQIEDQISDCRSDIYILVSQPNVSADDFQTLGSATRLGQAISGEDGSIQTSYSIPDVLGTLDIDRLTSTVQSKCKATLLSPDESSGLYELSGDAEIGVIQIAFDKLSEKYEQRRLELKENDAALDHIISRLPTEKYTVLYTTSAQKLNGAGHGNLRAGQRPAESPLSRSDLRKRESTEDYADNPTNRSVPENAPLFEKYQYFTPGLFMGLVVAFIMLLLLSTGLSGISGLQVTYAAFDKETGPLAHKKQQ